MQNIAILGATGYTARELMLILLRHPQARIVRVTSRQADPVPIVASHPELRGRLDLMLCRYEVEDLVRANVDFVFSCLPHAASAAAVREILDRGMKVVDFSADYRLDDVATFREWYGTAHPDPDRVGQTPYGLPELFRQSILGADLVANPGCFPTSAVLPLAPLVKQRLVELTGIVVDSKTGVSGGGRTPKPAFHFPECNESVSAYAIGTHRHTPEIGQILARFSQHSVGLTFTPHLIPMNRGILSTIYVQPQAGIDVERIRDALVQFYRNEPFVRIVDSTPATRQVSGTNDCDISVHAAGSHVILTSAIDNLIKGAAGAAVQNFNLMCGFPETTGLR